MKRRYRPKNLSSRELAEFLIAEAELTENGCRISSRSVRAGYPQVGEGPRAGYAVRPIGWLVLEEFSRPKRAGEVMRHLCNDRRCIEPSHLTWGTWQENTLDRIADGRHSVQKLTAIAVCQLRTLRKMGWSYKELAAMFGITIGNVGHVVSRRSWSHV